ncbi:MAG: pyridoxal phosphate-dependent aminotransferase [Candidatus Heimdallarchaeota archaeon]|nr:MAG: pyridoxal phosphate-dependent aminotransferase [Candidatus Heimdallarchaeota archaeon]
MEIVPAIRKLRPSATLAINELVVNKRNKGEKIFHMGFGESPFPVHERVRRSLCNHADKKYYAPTQGYLALRKQISFFYKEVFNLDYSPKQIIVALGSKSLIFHALSALDGPLLLPTPSWVSYQHQAYLIHKKVIYVQTSPQSSYLLTPSLLLASLEKTRLDLSRQKLLLLNYPCNPTGQSYSKKQLQDLVPILRKNNIVVIADEIYSLISYNNQEHHSLAEFYPEGTIITGGFSKDRSLGGYRLGVLLLPKRNDDVKRSILSIISEIWSSASSPIQYAAIEAYSPDKEIIDYIERCTRIHKIMTNYVYSRLQEARISCVSPKGGFYLFPDWNDKKDVLRKMKITTSKKLAKYLLESYNIATLPGSEFGMPKKNLCLRLSTVDYDGSRVLDEYNKNSSDIDKNPSDFIYEYAPNLVIACNILNDFTSSLNSL